MSNSPIYIAAGSINRPVLLAFNNTWVRSTRLAIPFSTEDEAMDECERLRKEGLTLATYFYQGK